MEEVRNVKYRGASKIFEQEIIMNLLKIIRDTDFGIETPALSNFKKREAARAVVFDKDKNIALLNVTKKNYHKLAGGGMEEGEDVEMALRREILEELGCNIENIRELGIIEEFRSKFAIHQVSYCFLADVVGEKGLPNFMGDEIEDGFKPEWMSLEQAILKMEEEANVEEYEGKFIRLRDLTFLKAVK